MNAADISIGLTMAYILYQILGIILPNKNTDSTPWSVPLQHNEAKEPSTKGAWSGVGKKFAFSQWFLKNASYRKRLELLLIRSGHPFQWMVEDLLFFKFVFVIIAVVLLWVYDIQIPILWVFGIIIGFQFLDFYMTIKATNRRNEIESLLPGFIDLLTLTIEGGLDLIAAVERIVDIMKPSALREELSMISQETRLGTPRKEALEHWVYRTNLPDIQSLSSMITQSEELGTSLSVVLRSYADDMRNRRIVKAEEIAGKAPVKLLFPMVVFFFPVVFIIIFGPLAMSVMNTTK